MSKYPYTKKGRLADVLALIQVLALDPDTKRSEEGITKELQGSPSSSDDGWFAVAKEHREFFRVNPDLRTGLSLVSRYVIPKDGDKRPTLSPDFSAALLQTAITLHDKQVQAKDWWKLLIPLWAALISAVVASGTTLLVLWLNGWCKP